MKTFSVLATVALLSAIAISADDPADREALPVRAEADKSPLNEAMKAVEFFEGNWRVEQKIKHPGHDKEMVTQGKFSVERGLKGRALVGHFEAQQHDNQPFFGHMVITSDKAQEGGQTRYGVYWADSEGITSYTTGAEMKDNKFMMTSEDKTGAKQGRARLTYTKVSDDRIDFEMSAETPKGWETHVTGTYTRVKAER
jgi:hypothetical protein